MSIVEKNYCDTSARAGCICEDPGFFPGFTSCVRDVCGTTAESNLAITYILGVCTSAGFNLAIVPASSTGVGRPTVSTQGESVVTASPSVAQDLAVTEDSAVTSPVTSFDSRTVSSMSTTPTRTASSSTSTTSSPSPVPTHEPFKLSKAAIGGIVVGVGLPLIAVAFFIIFCCMNEQRVNATKDHRSNDPELHQVEHWEDAGSENNSPGQLDNR
ncbi:hypothetical protein ABW20_dc0102291 [Dactylellina cionopaga]|nr:hypothetical protein ABW20_dc0102291 [Dactylellina cionopaga]